MWRYVLAAAAVAFILYLAVKMRPRARARRIMHADVRAARDRAGAADSPRARAEALCEAAQAAARAGRWTSAVGLFLRAMRADPTWPGSVEAAAAALASPRPKLLEQMLWRRLGATSWDGPERDATLAVARALEGLYARRLRDRARAEVMRRLVARL